MADYSGTSPVGYGEKATGQYYQEVKWSDGLFRIGDGDDVTSEATITNQDHCGPKYLVDFTLDKNKQLTVTFRSEQKSSLYFFGYKVGYEAWDEKHKNDVIRCISTNVWQWRGNYNIKKSDLTLDKADLSKLEFPIYIRAICDGCPIDGRKGCAVNSTNIGYITGFAHYSDSPKYGPNGTYGGGAYKIIQAHTHIADDIKAPIIVKTSGTTITVKCNTNDTCASNKGYVNETGSETWYSDNHTFTGYKQKTTKTFRSRRYCGDDCTEEDKYFESKETAKGQTWYIDGGIVSSSSNQLVFQVVHYPGLNGGNISDTNVICGLYESVADRSLYKSPIKTITFAGSSDNITFDNLTNNKTYYLRAWSDGIKNEKGELDNFIDIDATTGNPIDILGANVYSSATTIKASIRWKVNSTSTGIKTCKIKCSNGTTRTISNPTSTTAVVGFTGLESGESYNIEFVITDNIGNEVTTTRTISTKEANAVVSKGSSSALIIRAKSNDEDNTSMRIALYSKDGTQIYNWSNIERNERIQYVRLANATEYICKTEIKDCYAYDIYGEVTSKNDSTTDIAVYTYALYAQAITDYIYSYQNAITFRARSYLVPSLTGSNPQLACTKDPVTGYTYKISAIKVEPMVEEGYQTPSSTAEKNLSIPPIGYYITDNIAATGLDYYTKYRITMQINDGYNKVWGTPFIAYTSFPYNTMYIDGAWRNVIPYIYTNGKWTPAVPYVNNDGEWREPHGDVY